MHQAQRAKIDLYERRICFVDIVPGISTICRDRESNGKSNKASRIGQGSAYTGLFGDQAAGREDCSGRKRHEFSKQHRYYNIRIKRNRYTSDRLSPQKSALFIS